MFHLIYGLFRHKGLLKTGLKHLGLAESIGRQLSKVPRTTIAAQPFAASPRSNNFVRYCVTHFEASIALLYHYKD
jgi:hypothetical protein